MYDFLGKAKVNLITKQANNIKMQKYKLIPILFRIALAIFVISMMPATYFCKLISTLMFKMFRYGIQSMQLFIMLFIPREIITRIHNYAYCYKNPSKKVKHNDQQIELSPRAKQTHIMNICEEASLSPHKMTSNHKILLLMQKMNELQEKVYKQSKQRCQIQKQLFRLNVEMMSKEFELDHIRNQNIKLKREMELLRGEIEGKQFQVEQYEDIAQFLEEEVGDFKARLKQLGRGLQIHAS